MKSMLADSTIVVSSAWSSLIPNNHQYSLPPKFYVCPKSSSSAIPLLKTKHKNKAKR